MQPIVVVLLTLLAAVVLKTVFLLIVGKGSLARLGLATQAFLRVMGDAETASKIAPLLTPPEPAPPEPERLSPEPVRLLGLLQREARVLDFFLEDIQGATDDQLGAGVRKIHSDAQAVIKEHLVLEPVLAQEEGATVEVPAGFDPSAIRLTGNVTGQPPFKGELSHHGWRVKDYKLPVAPEGQDELVLAPAEVQIP